MANVLDSAHARVLGERDGHGRTADGELELNFRAPMQSDGAGGGTQPEEPLAMSSP
jgi:organic hydroperoxide reductase OsmC/OhrA